MMLASFCPGNSLLYHFNPYSIESVAQASDSANNPFACFENWSDALFNGLSDLGTAFVQGLDSLCNTVSYYGKHYLFGFDKKDIDNMTYRFAANLLSVASLEQNEGVNNPIDGILSRKSLYSILKKIQQETAFNDVSKLIQLINQRQHDHLSVEEWAYVSLVLDKISTDFTKELNYTTTSTEGQNTLRRRQFILKNLTHLNEISRCAWAQLAQEKIIDELEKHYKPVWKLGYSESSGGNFSVGGSVGGLGDKGASAGIKGSLKYEAEKFVDEEGNYCERNLGSAGVSAKLKVDLSSITKVSADLSGELVAGNYKQWHSARLFATNQFTTLIQEATHRNNPEIARYLSRSSTLSQAQKQISTHDGLLTATQNEVADANKLRSNYELKKAHIEQQFSLLVTTGKTPQKPVTLSSTPIMPANFVEATIIGNTEKASISAKVGRGFFSVSAQAQRKHLIRQMVVNTPLCKRLNDTTRPATEKIIIHRQIKAQFLRFQSQLPVFPDDKITTLLTYFKEDFAFYVKQHAAIAMNGGSIPSDELFLKQHIARYGAENAEQFIHRLVVSNAYLFMLAGEEKNDGLKKELLEFEQTLLSPQFNIDKTYLKEHAYFRDDIEYELVDKKVIIEAASSGSKFKFEGIYRRQIHANSLRDASYLDGAVTILGGIENINNLIQSIAPAFTEHLPKQLAEQVLSQLEHQFNLIAPAGSLEYGTTFYFRTGKPVMFSHVENFSYRPFFTRESNVVNAKLGINASIPVGVANVNLGFALSYSSSNCKKETFASNTMLYLALLYMHDMNINLIDKKTGVVTANSFWNTIREEQKDALQQLFINYANERKLLQAARDNKTPLPQSGLISQEITEIGRLIKANQQLDASVYPAWREAVKQFKNVARQCEQDATSEAQFQLTLKCFEKLLHTYFPHWSERKSNSSLLKPRALAPIEM